MKHQHSQAIRLSAILDAVLGLRPDERSYFLDTECANDPELRDVLDQLLAAAVPTDDFLERPAFVGSQPYAAAPEPDRYLFSVGDEIAGRFRIVRLIGVGGMGEVYEAYDRELGTAVALKTLRAHIASELSAVERFRREVLRARRVAHRHVCRVYDLFAHLPEGSPPVRFLTMELLEGVTLAEHLAVKGALSVEETSRIATDVAAALDEAHRLQIVHRDLKPGNIMLIEGRGAVVTDFGLALELTQGVDPGPIHHSEVAGGTEEYMAPEQRSSGGVGAAADLYAFGIVLREMLSGVRPGRTQSANHARMPPNWRSAIEACLRVEPDLRPRTASAVLRLARGRPQTRQTALAVGAVLALLTGLSLSFLFLRFYKQGASAASPTLVLSQIGNGTGEVDLNGVTDVLRYQLTQSMFLNVLESSEVSEVLRQMVRAPNAPLTVDLAREVAWRRGAEVILSGRLAQANNRGYTLTLRVERRGAQPDVAGQGWLHTFEARDRTELQRILGEAGRWVRGRVGETAEDIPRADQPVAQVTSNSWEAVALFSRAEGLAAESRRDDALALLAEAVRIDPDFALARMRMGDILMSQRHLDEAARNWDEALRVFARRRLTPREVYRIRGLYAHDAADYGEAERIYRLWLLVYQNDSKPLFYIARPLLMLGRVDEGIARLEAAQRKDGYSFYIPAHLAMFQMRAGHLNAAKPPIARLHTLGQSAWADCLQGQLDFLNGQYATALTRFEALESSTDASLRSRAPALQAAVLAELGQRDEALARLERGINADRDTGALPSQADKLLAAASLQLRMKRFRECRDLCIQAEQVDQSADRLTQTGALLAQAGYPADAERLFARLDPVSTVRSMQRNRYHLAGEILLARHDVNGAWRQLQRAAALDAPGIPLEYLARSAVAAGEKGAALAMYKRMATDPGYYWHYPDLEFPGAWSDAIAAYVRLAARVAPDTDTSTFQRQYRSLTHPQSSTAH